LVGEGISPRKVTERFPLENDQTSVQESHLYG
jgi:hypothetical protein